MGSILDGGFIYQTKCPQEQQLKQLLPRSAWPLAAGLQYIRHTDAWHNDK